MAQVVIKKYGNRRLYDTDASRYITLEELAERIRGGANVRVVDAKSDDDLTQSTLAQIILESRGASRLLPVPLLTQLIRLGDDALADFFGRYVSASLEMYLQARQGVQALQPLHPFMQMPFGMMSQMPWMPGMPAAPAPTPAAPPPAREPAADDVATLRRELEELKRSMSKRKR